LTVKEERKKQTTTLRVDEIYLIEHVDKHTKPNGVTSNS